MTAPEPCPQKLTQEDFDKKPWKYIGYKGYSEFLGSESNFLVFKRFNTANARIALVLQDQVSELTERLKQVDEKYSDKGAKDVDSSSLRHDQSDRKVLLQELHEALIKYSQSSHEPIRAAY